MFGVVTSMLALKDDISHEMGKQRKGFLSGFDTPILAHICSNIAFWRGVRFDAVGIIYKNR